MRLRPGAPAAVPSPPPQPPPPASSSRSRPRGSVAAVFARPLVLALPLGLLGLLLPARPSLGAASFFCSPRAAAREGGRGRGRNNARPRGVAAVRSSPRQISTAASSSSLGPVVATASPGSMPSDDPTAAIASPTGSAADSASSPAPVLPPRRQSVAVVGSGAVGGFYGVRLWEAGHRVYFHVRGLAELEQVRRDGFRLESSVHGGASIPPDLVRAHGSPSEMAQALRREAEEEEAGAPAGGASASEASSFDWVVVALKSSSLGSVPALIEPLLDPRKTRVLVIMNGLVEDDLIELLKRHFREAQEEEEVQADGGGASPPPPLACCRALYGGMAFLCSNRLGPGQISHTYAGRLSVGVASSSRRRGGGGGGDDSKSETPAAADDEDDEQDDPDRKAVEELWRGVIPEVPLSWEPSLLAGRWRKNVWNLAFNGLSTAMGGWTVDLVASDPSLRRLASGIMDETIAAGNADLVRRYGKEGGERHAIEPEYKQVLFDLTDRMGPYKTSTMLDLTNRRPMEVKYLFQEPVRRARELGVPVPRLGAVVAQIEALQRRHGL